MPREFLDDPTDRYIIEEEGDVTEIYFILSGDWAIAFDSFAKSDLSGANQDIEDDEMLGTPDMIARGILIASRKSGHGFFGDYYVLASKRSQFFYVALTQVTAYALTKNFLFKRLFEKFPGLHSDMLAESFSRYIKVFRTPCGMKRNETIQFLNQKK